MVERRDGDEAVEEGVAVAHREHAEHDGERHGDDGGGKGEEERVAEALADVGRDVLAVRVALAEIALHGAAEPLEIADDGRLIEAELGADIGDRLRRRLLAEHGGRDVAGQDLRAGEDQHRHGP